MASEDAFSQQHLAHEEEGPGAVVVDTAAAVGPDMFDDSAAVGARLRDALAAADALATEETEETEEIEDTACPLLHISDDRFVMFPIRDPQIWKMFKDLQLCLWSTEEIDLSVDVIEWRTKLNDEERHFISHVLAFFAGADGIVNENLAQRFSTEVQLPEARSFYTCQAFNETIHSETYSFLIDTLITDAAERTRLFTAVTRIPTVGAKARWAMRWLESKTKTFGERLVAFAAVEGIFFSGSFCAIFWLKKRGLLPGLCFSNELISRDEGLHGDFALLLVERLREYGLAPDEATIHAIFREAVVIEREFVCEALPVAMIGMNNVLMSQYIEYIADYWCRKMRIAPIFNVANPFPWMENISMQGKTNFFERRVAEYQKALSRHTVAAPATSQSATPSAEQGQAMASAYDGTLDI